MHRHAAKSAAQSKLSLNARDVAFRRSRVRKDGCSEPLFGAVFATTKKLRFGRTTAPGSKGWLSVHWGVIRLVSRPLLGVTLRGQTGARRLGVVLLRLQRPAGHGTSRNKFVSRGKKRRTNFFRAPPGKHSLALGSRAHSLGFAWCDPSRIREFNETENITMYQNKVTLIGFLGNDAEVRTNNDRNLTTLSLATKSSYKKDGKYIEHTEWHRCVAFGKLGEFAAALSKGAHIQIEGELRSRKYDSKKTNSEQTVWEIRVNSILKLDRTAKASAEDEDDSTEEEAG
jgi:single-strand DNA-binding protein